jgi:hypothetical protein
MAKAQSKLFSKSLDLCTESTKFEDLKIIKTRKL